MATAFSELFELLMGKTQQTPVDEAKSSKWSLKGHKASAEMLDQVKQDIRKSAFDAATTHLASARSVLGDDKSVLIASAELAQAQCDWPEAYRRWQRVIDEHPDTVMAHMHRALIVQATGDFLGAVELFRQVIEDFPDAVGAPISIVNLLDKLDESQRTKFSKIADASLASLIKTHPGYTILYITRARLAKASDDWKGAHAFLVQAYEMDRTDSNIWSEIRSTLEVIESRRKRAGSIFE